MRTPQLLTRFPMQWLVITATAYFYCPSLLALTAGGQSKDGGVVISMRTGAGVFQDVQMPINERTGMRADGRPAGLEQTDHYGIPLKFSVGKDMRRENWTLGLNFSHLRIDTLIKQPEASQSSYTQTQISILPGYKFTLAGVNQQLAAGTIIRRSSYLNISTGHLVDAILPAIAWSVQASQRWAIEVLAARSILSITRYDDGATFSPEGIPGSQSTVKDFSLNLQRAIGPNVWMHLGFMQETSTLAIDNIKSYERFNLDILSFGAPERNYRLSTRSMTVGFDKLF